MVDEESALMLVFAAGAAIAEPLIAAPPNISAVATRADPNDSFIIHSCFTNIAVAEFDIASRINNRAYLP